MLQLRALNEQAMVALDAEGEWWPDWESMPELEAAADVALMRLRDRRAALASRAGGLEAARAWLDQALYTDEAVEFLDRPETTERQRSTLIHKLHRLNRVIGSYHRWLGFLRPNIQAIARRERRPARALELASGAGEFSLELARLAQRKGLPVEVTGSDVIPAYVDAANRKAAARGLPIRFRRLNAFQLESLTPGDFDLVFIIQSIHHFTPGQLAMMIAQARFAGARYFVGVDGRRSLALLGLMPLLTSLAGPLDRRFLHDGLVSARRFYAEDELALVARIAAPGAKIAMQRAEPGFSVLRVKF
jgi:SAM-dependent methyltransferase